MFKKSSNNQLNYQSGATLKRVSPRPSPKLVVTTQQSSSKLPDILKYKKVVNHTLAPLNPTLKP
jgi:hypothetical protein